MQAQRKCEVDSRCFVFDMADFNASAAAAADWPGVAGAASQLGYASAEAYAAEARSFVEPIMALSTFCLTPPGDTPKRRGLIDAWAMGCIPVIFIEASRDLELFLLPEESRSMSVLLAPEALLEGADGELTRQLEAAADAASVRSMQAAAAERMTQLHWAYSDLYEADHASVGPDAWDVLLVGLKGRRSAAMRRRARWR